MAFPAPKRRFLESGVCSRRASVAGLMPFWNLCVIPSKMGRYNALDWSVLTSTVASRVMLQAMQPATSTPSSPDASDFAGLLATLTAPPANAAEDESLWSSSDLGGDVVSLSYERALRAHARYRPADRDEVSIFPSEGSGTGDTLPASSAAAPQRDLRTASVTIRLSKAESAQLHRRAAEAGLTVSAYLRSCALEAEELRAQVKLALAELKTGNEGTTKQGTGNKEQATEGQSPRARESKRSGNRGSEGVRLARVFGRIGKLWIGLSAGESS